ncbi:hypothetical protein [Thiohalophilus sp.]|uniref:hypothetical protein n=1 Tax=Thiohalophilus sp. TaxID=3028392 RepID=UPI002ACD82CF|nr:hypothetical protein [Thiohalophilus sp.]MDZ7804965.1 hypothetical protein [Thiohalophilus sp.]
MARLPRICLPGIPQHVIQRGNNRQVCFASEEDFSAYAHWLEEYARKCQVAGLTGVAPAQLIEITIKKDKIQAQTELKRPFFRQKSSLESTSASGPVRA